MNTMNQLTELGRLAKIVSEVSIATPGNTMKVTM